MWTLATVDLVLTLWANHYTLFYECNPIARPIVSHHLTALTVVYKFVMLGVGTAVFLVHCRHRWTEAAVWLLTFAYVGLMFQWSEYTAHADELYACKQMAEYAGKPAIPNFDEFVARAQRGEFEGASAHQSRLVVAMAHSVGPRFTPAMP